MEIRTTDDLLIKCAMARVVQEKIKETLNMSPETRLEDAPLLASDYVETALAVLDRVGFEIVRKAT